MRFPIKPICEKRFMRKDGCSIIYIQYCYTSKKRTLLNTRIDIPAEFLEQEKIMHLGRFTNPVWNGR